MTAYTWRHYCRLRGDWRAVTLVGLFMVVIGGALALRPALLASGTQSAVSGSSTASQAGAGVAWAVGEALFAGALLGVLLLVRRAPEWCQAIGRRAILIGFWVFVGFVAAPFVGAVGALALVLLAYISIQVLDHVGVYWVVNDLLALAAAVYFGAFVGIILGPVIIALGLVGLTAYDYYFADRKAWMFSLAAWTVRWKLPALFVAPTAWRFDWADIVDVDDPAEDDIGFGIGMADLLLPAAFAVAVANTGGGLPLAGVIAGTLVACFRLSQKMHERSGAGLPALTTGALGGWALAVAVGVVA